MLRINMYYLSICMKELYKYFLMQTELDFNMSRQVS